MLWSVPPPKKNTLLRALIFTMTTLVFFPLHLHSSCPICLGVSVIMLGVGQSKAKESKGRNWKKLSISCQEISIIQNHHTVHTLHSDFTKCPSNACLSLSSPELYVWAYVEFSCMSICRLQMEHIPLSLACFSHSWETIPSVGKPSAGTTQCSPLTGLRLCILGRGDAMPFRVHHVTKILRWSVLPLVMLTVITWWGWWMLTSPLWSHHHPLCI